MLDYSKVSIHAPLAGCDIIILFCGEGIQVSIHAPLAGCDFRTSSYGGRMLPFQSTHPSRGATRLL